MQAFLPLAPAAIPAGLVLASLLWAWRAYPVTGGIGGRMASAPVTSGTRQWRRQVRAAEGWAGLVHRRPGRARRREGGPAAADRAGLQEQAGRPP